MARFFRGIFFLLKLSVFAAVAFWLYLNPGQVRLEWGDTIIETGTGFAALVLFILISLVALAYHFWRRILAVPQHWRQRRRIQALEDGFAALNRGLLGVAAGDSVTAAKSARKAVALLPDMALTHLLAAQAAHLQQDEVTADAHLALLARHPEGALFGLRGQITRALQRGDQTEALRLTRLAYQQQPSQPWVIDMALRMETRRQNWLQAEKILRQALRLGMENDARWQHDLAAVLVAESDAALQRQEDDAALECAREALRRRAGWSVAATRVARLWQRKTYRRRAQKTLLAAWEQEPHPDILQEWLHLAGGGRAQDKTALVEKLASVNPDSYESCYALAEVYCQSRLWGVARQYALRAMGYRPDRAVYRLLADIEQGDSNNPDHVRGWLDKAAEAEAGKQWQCRTTGVIYPAWQVLNHQMDFNTIEWQIPYASAASERSLSLPANALADSYLDSVASPLLK